MSNIDNYTQAIKRQPNQHVEWIECGIDWLSATLASDHVDYDDVARVWQDVAVSQHDDDNKMRATRINGYDGFMAGSAFFGTRKQDCHIKLSSALADMAFDTVAHPAMHISRLDLQLTIKYKQEQPNVGRNAYHKLSRLYRTPTVPPAPQPREVKQPDGSFTVYCGSAAAQHFGRIYSKHHQSSDERYINAWRYEIVLKNRLATSLYGEIPRYDSGRAEWVFGVVRDWWQHRGIRLHLVRTISRPSLIRPRIPASDAKRKLQWLETAVKPSVAFLISRGYTDEVLSALGLSNVCEAYKKGT